MRSRASTAYHAILGASAMCVATHPSDMCVALAALDARRACAGHERRAHACRSPTSTACRAITPTSRPCCEPGELITAVELPRAAHSRRARPIARCATGRATPSRWSRSPPRWSSKVGLIKDVRIALGGVAHKPWRALKAEAALRGGPATEQAFRAAAKAELADARPLRDNGFKIELASARFVAVLGELLERQHEHRRSRQDRGTGPDEAAMAKWCRSRPTAGCRAATPTR